MTVAQFNEPVASMDILSTILALLNGPTALDGLSTPAHAYQWDKSPKDPKNTVLVSAIRTFGGNQRLGLGIAPSAWYLTATAIGSVSNATAMMRRCTLTLEGVEVTVDGVTSTALSFLSESGPNQDDDDRALWTLTRVWNLHF